MSGVCAHYDPCSSSRSRRRPSRRRTTTRLGITDKWEAYQKGTKGAHFHHTKLWKCHGFYRGVLSDISPKFAFCKYSCNILSTFVLTYLTLPLNYSWPRPLDNETFFCQSTECLEPGPGSLGTISCDRYTLDNRGLRMDLGCLEVNAVIR